MRKDYIVGLFVYQDAADFSQVGDVASLLLNERIDYIFSAIEKYVEELPRVATSNIPEFSKAQEIDKVLSSLIETGAEFRGFLELGRLLCRAEKEPAQRKYGENHYKLAALLGLVTRTFPMKVTELGRQYYELDEDGRKDLFAKLILRIPIIQQLLIMAKDEYVDVDSFFARYLAPSTVNRRTSSTRNLIDELARYKSETVRERTGKLIW